MSDPLDRDPRFSIFMPRFQNSPSACCAATDPERCWSISNEYIRKGYERQQTPHQAQKQKKFEGVTSVRKAEKGASGKFIQFTSPTRKRPRYFPQHPFFRQVIGWSVGTQSRGRRQ